MKSPAVQMRDEEARQRLEQFIANEGGPDDTKPPLEVTYSRETIS